nr:tRNA (adenine(22)-N(1))-methyltransferase TrmK [uncultured Pseudomonas sp.]
MNEHTLSMRLERVAAHVPQGARLADIGSDHGYLPVALMLRGRIEQAVAGEVAGTPFAAAQRNVRKQGLEPRIAVRLADGLAAIEREDRITVVSMCGMGGETLCEILEAGKARLAGVERLVLQPNGAEPQVRQWLMAHGYRIVAEEVLREHRFDYEIIVAEPGCAAYSPEQLYFGPVLMQEHSQAFHVKWQRMLGQKKQTLANFARARAPVPSAKVADFERQVGWITRLLAECPQTED